MSPRTFKIIGIVVFSFFLLSFFFSGKDKSKENKESSSKLYTYSWLPSKQVAESSGVKLLALEQKGLIKVHMTEPSPMVSIEPLGWRGLTHQEKIGFTQTALQFFAGLGQEKKKDFRFLFVRDMTTNDKLATGFFDDGHVEVEK